MAMMTFEVEMMDGVYEVEVEVDDDDVVGGAKVRRGLGEGRA